MNVNEALEKYFAAMSTWFQEETKLSALSAGNSPTKFVAQLKPTEEAHKAYRKAQRQYLEALRRES